MENIIKDLNQLIVNEKGKKDKQQESRDEQLARELQNKEDIRQRQILSDEQLARSMSFNGGNPNYKNKYLIYKKKYLLLKKK
jgi:hypothetical protein